LGRFLGCWAESREFFTVQGAGLKAAALGERRDVVFEIGFTRGQVHALRADSPESPRLSRRLHFCYEN